MAPRSSRSRAARSKSSSSEAAYISSRMRLTNALVWPPMKSQKSSTIARWSSAEMLPDARGRALVDVAEQAGAPDLAGALEHAVGAGPHREDAQQLVDRLADRPGVAVGAEVPGALLLRAATDHHPRVLLADGHRQPGVGLVVAVLDVVARVELLDPAVLQLERLDLGVDDGPLDAGGGGDHGGGAGVEVADVLEVRRQPRAEVLRLADVDDPAPGVAELVDARLGRDLARLRTVRRRVRHVLNPTGRPRQSTDDGWQTVDRTAAPSPGSGRPHRRSAPRRPVPRAGPPAPARVTRSPGASTGTPGGYGATTSAQTRPAACAHGTASRGAKNASRGVITCSASTIQAAWRRPPAESPRRRSTAAAIAPASAATASSWSARVTIGISRSRSAISRVKPWPSRARGRPRCRRRRCRPSGRRAWRRRSGRPRSGRPASGSTQPGTRRRPHERGARGRAGPRPAPPRGPRAGPVPRRRGQDRSRGRGRGRGLDRPVEPVGVEETAAGSGAGEDQGTLVQRRQRLVGAGHHDVRPGGERVRWQVRVAAEVGTPGRVDHQRDAGRAGHSAIAPMSAQVPTYDGLVTKTARASGCAASASATTAASEPQRKTRRRVDRRVEPHRPEPGQHEPEQDRPVAGAVDEHGVARGADRERRGLVAVAWSRPRSNGTSRRRAARLPAPRHRGAARRRPGWRPARRRAAGLRRRCRRPGRARCLCPGTVNGRSSPAARRCRAATHAFSNGASSSQAGSTQGCSDGSAERIGRPLDRALLPRSAAP